LDQLKPTETNSVSQELIQSIQSEPHINRVFNVPPKKTKKGRFSDDKQYEITNLASGADGTVYKINYKGHISAIKVIDNSPLSSSSSNQWLALMNEIYILSSFNKLNHFLKFYSYIIKDDLLFIIMECYDGEEFFGKDQKMSMKDKKLTFKNMFHGIYQMHKLDMVHTDLHMGNVLFKSTSDFKIIDFGRAICYGDNFTHKYCKKQNYLNVYPYSKGFSGGFYQIAPWRSKQCGTSGCSKKELMAGDLWALCYYFADNRHILHRFAHDSNADNFLNDIPSIYRALTDKELPQEMINLYN